MACSSIHLPQRDADVAGRVGKISGGGDQPLVLMVGENAGGESWRLAKAKVTVTPDTEVLVRGAGTICRSTASSIREGDAAEVWFKGAVMKSYPVQAEAETIVVTRSDSCR